MAAESARLRRAGFLDSSCDLVADAARERWRSAAAAAAGYPEAAVMAMSGAIPLIPGLLGRGDDGGGGGGGGSRGVEDDDDDDDDDEDDEYYQDEDGEHDPAARPGGGRRATRRACGWVRNRLLRHESRVVGYLGRFSGARAWAEGWLTALEARLDRHLRDIVPAAADGRRGEEPLGDPEAVVQLLGKVQMRARRLRRRENKKSAPRVRFNVLGRL
ncbi:hypothetical protein GGTG_13996 [Gaeumannomyces tritici R3-111a-1]|uniref:Uncharacterized protein n=1 Tax=Gaeumannomyces tritici (strain R3-111a-1) TaxID=644352 RepID=J3PKE2_GAET3|nr:hypothetical protein GGTG_13996 [Gaeumannomyces tritici R3-111a-1]EJT68423.1 hypothetical protein GGTG_13996 [Gaeumannomyces tritici R3-111a-1]